MLLIRCLSINAVGFSGRAKETYLSSVSPKFRKNIDIFFLDLSINRKYRPIIGVTSIGLEIILESKASLSIRNPFLFLTQFSVHLMN